MKDPCDTTKYVRLVHSNNAGTTLGWVSWVPVNPWISRIITKEPMDFQNYCYGIS